jgi:hypothetical protein
MLGRTSIILDCSTYSSSQSSPLESNKIDRVCDAYQQDKSHQLPFSLSSHVANSPLKLIYSDVWDPVQTSFSGHNYYVIFVDAYI